MIPLRRLKDCDLEVSISIKQDNGTVKKSFNLVKKYKISFQELTDAVSASVYGANINVTYRITSPYSTLEKYLSTKVHNEDDNISKYFIFYNDKRYKIVSVKENWVDIELI